MLFFKGFFLLLPGLHRYVSGDDKWNQPFEMIRDGDHTFSWTAHGPTGLIAPGWYLAPQRREVAEASWTLIASLMGALDDRPIRRTQVDRACLMGWVMWVH